MLFSSEIKSIFQSQLVSAIPNNQSISNFLSLGYCPGEESAFRGVYKVLAGTRITIKDQVDRAIWWEIPSHKENDKELSGVNLKVLLKRSWKRRRMPIIK